ncbi:MULTISPECIES: ATP-binding protein [Streptomyces]|uniref:ATP-binding protein n=1 Tax=Streptomyces tendae TaxID=1932 RepID=A0ABX5ZZU7_STRTE|nr:ATP-binding protein [Streptomyces tendae]QER89297.1 ATP-binding protein [Streptomyces tendae]
MSTTRPYSPGDRGPEPSGASGTPGGAAPIRGAQEGGVAVPTAPEAVPGPAGDAQVRRLSFEDQSGVVPLARDFTRQALYDWGWLPAATADRRAAAEDVLLVVSELVTNACLHAEGPDLMIITSDRKVIRIEVTDRGTGQPSPRTPHRAGRPGGHGMFIVQRLCLDWGVVRSADVAGKTVWAELGTPS